MPARRGDLLAHDAQQSRHVDGVELVGRVVVVRDHDEVVAGLAGAPADLGRRVLAVAVARVQVDAAAEPGRTRTQRSRGPRGERGHGQGVGDGGRLGRESDVHSGRPDLVESEQHVPLPRRERAGPVPRAGRARAHRDRGRRPAAPSAEGGGAEVEGARLEQAEVHDVRASRLVVGIRDGEARRALGDGDGRVLVTPHLAVLRRVVEAHLAKRRWRRDRRRRRRLFREPGGESEREERQAHGNGRTLSTRPRPVKPRAYRRGVRPLISKYRSSSAMRTLWSMATLVG